MGIRGDGYKRIAFKPWVIRLLVALFAIRALIPAGYMPDFAAVAQGTFKVTICTPSGSRVLTLDAGGAPVEQPANHQDQPCAFSGLASVAPPEIDAIIVPVPHYWPAAILPAMATVLPFARAEPAHGSRAPPMNS